MKKCFLLVLALLLLGGASAHPGRLDTYGGHRDWENLSGLGYYHFHCDGREAHLHPHNFCPFREDTAVAETVIPAKASGDATGWAMLAADGILLSTALVWRKHRGITTKIKKSCLKKRCCFRIIKQYFIRRGNANVPMEGQAGSVLGRCHDSVSVGRGVVRQKRIWRFHD